MARNLFINLDANDPRNSLVESFTSTSAAVNQIFVRDDDFQVRLHFLRKNTESNSLRPFIYVAADAEFTSTILAIGDIDARPDSGTFTITDTAAVQTTGAIAYNASAATVQTAIRAALTTNWSVAVVTAGDTDGTWSVDRGSVGAIAALTGSTAALVPTGSKTIITRTNIGDASTNGIQFIELVRAAAIGFGGTWDAFDPALVSPSILQAGSASANKIYSIIWNKDSFDGSVWLSVLADAVTSTVGPIKYDATSDEVVTAFEVHSGIDSGEVTVTKESAGSYTVTFSGGSLANSNAPTISTAINTLSVPLGLSAQVSCDTAGVINLLNGAESATATIEVEITDTDGNTSTPVQDAEATLLADLIRNTPAISSATDKFVQVNASNEMTSPTSLTVPVTLGIGIAGVTMTGADGVLTITGAGTGSDESMIINLDDVANTIGFTSSTGVTNWDFATSVTTELFLTDVSGGGSATAPAFSRSTDTNTGMYFSGADEVSFTTGGTRRLKIASSNADFAVPVEIPDGTAGAPGLRFDGSNTTGLFYSSGDIGVAFSGARGLTLSNQNIYLGSVTSATPSTGIIRGVGGSGTNISGGSTYIAGGISTGLGLGGSVIIGTTPSGASGSSQNTLTDRLTVTSTGAVVIGSATAAGTGQLELPSSTSATAGIAMGDVNLYRSASNTLKTDDSLMVSGNITGGTGTATSYWIVDHTGAGNSSIRFQSTATDKWQLQYDDSTSLFYIWNFTTSASALTFADATSNARFYGNVGIGAAASTYLDVNGDKFRVRTAKTPSSASDTGNAGDICWDTSYIYVCTAANTWKRVAIATW